MLTFVESVPDIAEGAGGTAPASASARWLSYGKRTGRR